MDSKPELSEEFKRRMISRLIHLQRARRPYLKSSLKSATNWVCRDKYIAEQNIPFEVMEELTATFAQEIGCDLDIDIDGRYSKDIENAPHVVWIMFPSEDIADTLNLEM